MSSIFSFIKHPIIGLLEKSGKLIPGLDKAIALYYDKDLNDIVCKGLILNNNHKNSVDDFYIADLEAAQKIRSRKLKHQWMSAKNLPFETEQPSKKQLNIFDELQNVVLCLGFNNRDDGNSDLIFLYLNQNKGNFGISNSNQNLSTSEKLIIGTLIYNNIQANLEQQLKDGETLKRVNEKIKSLNEENESLNRKLINLKENYLASIVEMCHHHLIKISNEYGIKFSLSADAIEKLHYFNGNIDELKEKLTDSALLAINMSFGQKQNHIVLKAWDIDFGKKVPNNNELPQSDVNERYQKTLNLLNKLESAARLVINKHQKMTSENVGNACPSPISAPAISDALKNHQKKLLKLMADHPDKWPTIRNEFRPIQNILHNSNVS